MLLNSVYLYKKVVGDIFTISISSLFFYCYIVFVYIGSVILFLRLDRFSVNVGVIEETYLLKMFLSTNLGLFLIPLGMMYVSWLLKHNPSIEIKEYIKKEVQDVVSKDGVYAFPIVCVLLGISFLFLYLYLLQTEIPILHLLSGSSVEELAILRSRATNAFTGNRHWYTLFLETLVPIISYICLSYFKKRDGSKIKWGILFLLTFFMASFIKVMTLQKAPLGWYYISLFLLIIYLYNKDFKLNYFILFSLVVFIILVVMYIFIMGYESIGTSLAKIFNRVFVGQVRPLYFYYKYFPASEDFLLGRSFPNPGGVFPYKPFPLTIKIHELIYRHRPDIVGSAPTVFFGEVYANFGLVVSFISMFLVGVYIKFIEIIFIKFLPKNPLSLSLFIYFAFHLKDLTATGLSQYVIDFYSFSIIFFFISILSGIYLFKQIDSNLVALKRGD